MTQTITKNDKNKKHNKYRNNNIEYYKKFNYRIEKKISVEDYPKIKDYAKIGVYIYIIHEEIDNNRFVMISSQHFEENTIITPNKFKLVNIINNQDNIQLLRKISRFGVSFFKIASKKGDTTLNFQEIIKSKFPKDKCFFKKYKTHNKKIALHYPDYYMEEIYKYVNTSHKKKTLKNMKYNNEYNHQIIEHAISTLFKLENPSMQKFNDTAIIIDEGKTGKSSFLSHNAEKVDNPSIAGLYGSSDGIKGKFKHGLIGITDKTIVIDELNELIENSKGEKVLSILNSLLENGVYNYVKQHSQKIYASNQFLFLCNISEEVNFATFILGCFGNTETIGRRIGIITYSSCLNGFVQGDLIPSVPSYYLECISQLLSNIFNEILNNTKFIKKLYAHKKYRYLEKWYKAKLTDIEKEIDNQVTRQFIKSHKASIDRAVIRGLKLWIFENMDEFIQNKKTYNNHSIYEVLCYTEKVLNQNIINFQNIKEHVTSHSIAPKIKEYNQIEFNRLTKNAKETIKFAIINKDNLCQQGIYVNSLKHKYMVRRIRHDAIKRGISNKINYEISKYGLRYFIHKNELVLQMINKNAFEKNTEEIELDEKKEE